MESKKQKYRYKYIMSDVEKLFDNGYTSQEQQVYNLLGKEKATELFKTLTSGSVPITLKNNEVVNVNFSIQEPREDEYSNNQKFTSTTGLKSYHIDILNKNQEKVGSVQLQFPVDPHSSTFSLSNLIVENSSNKDEIVEIILDAVDELATEMKIVKNIHASYNPETSKYFADKGYREIETEFHDRSYKSLIKNFKATELNSSKNQPFNQ